LLHYINSYHESDQYIEMAQSIIDGNDLEHYDNVAICNKYLATLTLESYLKKLP